MIITVLSAAVLIMSIASCSIDAASLNEPAFMPTVGKISETRGEMVVGRAAHTATRLGNDKVLIVGGMKYGGGSIDAAEIFDSKRVTFLSTGKLGTPRAGHTASLLPDGRVLIAGGYDERYLGSSEIYDPRTGRFEPGPQLTTARSEHTATVLPDGSVLLIGGVGEGWTFLADAEIFDPKSGKFNAVRKMSTPRESHTATLLQNGKVLITGGHKDRRAAMTIYSSTEIFDTATRTFSAGPTMTVRRHKHDAALLNDGRVIITGGSDERDSRGAYTSVEVYDPKTNRFSKLSDMREARYKLNGAVAVLENGTVLIAGGSHQAELYDPVKGTSEIVSGSFGSKRLFSAVTSLGNGAVLITGGYNELQQIGRQAWVYSKPK